MEDVFHLGQSSGPPLGELRSVAVAAIAPNRYQPRQYFDDEQIEDLAASIAALGVLQPIIVRECHEAELAAFGNRPIRYELIAGERRWRAAQKAGLREIPAIIRLAGNQAALEEAIVENLHRADLNVLEEAAAYRQLIREFNLTQGEVAERVGKSRSAVANTLRLLQLPEEVQRLVVEGAVSGGHARALLAYPEPDAQLEFAHRIVTDGLSVRDVEELVRKAGRQRKVREGSSGQSPGSVKAAGILEIEERLGEHLDTNVVANVGAGKRGRLVIEFADEADLGRIYRLLSGEGFGGDFDL